MRFVGVLRSERARDERVPRHVSRPRFAQRACEREQHRTPRERDHRACVTHDMTAGVHDECLRRQQRFDLLEQEESLLATRNQARRGRVQDEGRAFDLRRQRRDTCVARGALGPSERRARRLRPQAPHRDARDDQLVGGSQCGRERRGIEGGERTLGLVEAADQEQAPDLEMPRMRGVDAVAVLLRASPAPRRAPSRASPGRARRARSRPRRRRISRGRRPLSDRRRAPRVAGGFRAIEIAELRHRDAAKRERRRVVAQRDPLQCTEGIARRERTRRGRDQRVHQIPSHVSLRPSTAPVPPVRAGTGRPPGHVAAPDRAPKGRKRDGRPAAPPAMNTVSEEESPVSTARRLPRRTKCDLRHRPPPTPAPGSR